VADISAIRRDLNWQPRVAIEDGIAEMAAWAKAETGKA
jgi:nucleoside-diphosphate-sugar epimerase